MPNFSEYIEQLIAYINNNTAVREYRTQSANTEVISAILEIVRQQEDFDYTKCGYDS